MLHLPKALLLAAALAFSLALPTLAQTWTVESIDREQEDATGPGFCVLRSSEGFVLSLSPYQNANYVGFSGGVAEKIGLRWLPSGPIQQMKALLQVDAGYKVLLNSTMHHVPRPESGGVLVDLYAFYPTGSDLITALRGGASVYMRVAEDLTSASSVQPSSATTRAFSLSGSSAAIAELEACVQAQPPINLGKALGQAASGLGAAIEAEINESLAAQSTQECKFHKGIWKSGTLRDARLFYMDDSGETGGHNVYFERWIDNEVVARMYGDLLLGAYAAGVSILDGYHPYDSDTGYAQIDAEDRIVTAEMETKSDSARDTPDTLIFVDLDRLIAGKGSDHVDFYGEVEDPENVFAGPNEFAFFGCRTEPLQLQPAPLNRP